MAGRTAAAATLSATYAQLDDDEDADASDTQLAADQAATRIEVTDGVEAGGRVVIAGLTADVPTGDSDTGGMDDGFGMRFGTGPGKPGGGAPVIIRR